MKIYVNKTSIIDISICEVYIITLSRLSMLNVSGRFDPIDFMNFGIISNGKNKLLRKNMGRAITNAESNAVFSEFDMEPSTNPINMKLIAASNNISIILTFIGRLILNSWTVKNITTNSIMETIRKNTIFSIINIKVGVGLNKVLASVPLFLSYTIFDDDTNDMVNSSIIKIRPGTRNSK